MQPVGIQRLANARSRGRAGGCPDDTPSPAARLPPMMPQRGHTIRGPNARHVSPDEKRPAARSVRRGTEISQATRKARA
jgi:hypothetical protein